jgi:hypothetical protein
VCQSCSDWSYLRAAIIWQNIHVYFKWIFCFPLMVYVIVLMLRWSLEGFKWMRTRSSTRLPPVAFQVLAVLHREVLWMGPLEVHKIRVTLANSTPAATPQYPMKLKSRWIYSSVGSLAEGTCSFRASVSIARLGSCNTSHLYLSFSFQGLSWCLEFRTNLAPNT